MTYESPLSCSVLMSKFIRPLPAARCGELRRVVGSLIRRKVVLRLGKLQPTELTPGSGVLRLLHRVLLQGRNRICRVALAFIRRREIAVALPGVRMILDLLLRLRD